MTCIVFSKLLAQIFEDYMALMENNESSFEDYLTYISVWAQTNA